MTAETAWVIAEVVNIDNVHLTVNVTGYWLPCVPLGTREKTGTKADFKKKKFVFSGANSLVVGTD